MEDSVKKLQAEFVDLLRKQVEALELDAYVGLTNDERMNHGSRGIVDALNEAHEALYAAMRDTPKLSGMGSTVVGVVARVMSEW